MFELTFQFENDEKPVVISVSPEESVLDAARKANVAIDAPCSGNGSCGKCRVKLVSGELTGPQTSHISDEEYADGWRLSCCMHAASDAVVLVPDIASAYRSRMKTADLSSGKEIRIFEELLAGVQGAGISLGNGFRAVDLQLDEPTLDDTMPDTERLARAVEAESGCEPVKLSYHVVQKLAKTLRDADFKVTASAVRQGDGLLVVDVTAKEDAPIYGCAIDIGTTTVTGVLMDLASGKLTAKASAGNGQIRYGADVINRIIEQGKPGGVKRLQDAILKETLRPMVGLMCKTAGITADRIFRVAIASNTTMNHLLLGVDGEVQHCRAVLLGERFAVARHHAVNIRGCLAQCARQHSHPHVLGGARRRLPLVECIRLCDQRHRQHHAVRQPKMSGRYYFITSTPCNSTTNIEI